MDLALLSALEGKVSGMSKPKLKICFYCIATHLGGAEKSLLEIVSNLERGSNFRYQPWVLLPKEEGLLVDLLKERKIPYDVLKLPPSFMKISRRALLKSIIWGVLSLPAMVLYFARLVRKVRLENVVVIHTTGIKCHF